MPYTVSISRAEAELLAAAEISGVEGTIFTYDPADTMKILAAAGEHQPEEGRSRLASRLGTLYGRYLVGQARMSAPTQALEVPDETPDLFSQVPPEPEHEPEQVAKPRRKRPS